MPDYIFYCTHTTLKVIFYIYNLDGSGEHIPLTDSTHHDRPPVRSPASSVTGKSNLVSAIWIETCY